MTTNLHIDEQFPDIELPNHQNELTWLSQFTKPGLLDTHLGFLDGYPLILVFYRGFFCPQQQWAAGAPAVGATGLPVAQGLVSWFDLNAGVGMIARDGTGEEVFFHFTALPGQGYRTIRAGTAVKFELVESGHGLTARNMQPKPLPSPR